MTTGRHRRQPGRARVLARIAELTALAGLVTAGITVPLAGLAGTAVKDSSKTFDTLPVPSVGSLPTRSEILASDGSLIAYYYPNHIYRLPVTYRQIAPPMRKAIVAIEDSRFYQHGAIDPQGTMRAVVADLTGGRVQGGSTLAQQYVKNALLLTAADSAEQKAAVADTLARKVRELRMAASVEHELSPDKLLAAYLNAAYFENQSYGVEVAAQRYFSTTAAKLTLDQSALLAGMVENPTQFNPMVSPGPAVARRNVVLSRMAQLHYISKSAAAAAQKAPLGLHYSDASLQQGCGAAGTAAWFCDYVIAELRVNPAYQQAWHDLNTTGGLQIRTTMSVTDQDAAQNAVNFMLPPPPSQFNPGNNAAAEVLVQPGTGRVQAIAVDRRYGSGPGQDSIDYAADSAANGGAGVQTGSSSKLFTLITALEQNVPFGFKLGAKSPSVVQPFYDCRGLQTGPFKVVNDEGPGNGTYTLYTGTTQSINVFYAELEQRVGLCNVVKTAVAMGDHRAGGGSLLSAAGRPGTASYQPPADDVPSFTLGAVNVSPMTMAAAYATVPAGGVYCNPVAIDRIYDATGKPLPVLAAGCKRVMPPQVAAAASYILQGVITSGTAKGDGITGHGGTVPQAGKTGTANSFDFAAFGGYTPLLAGYVSMFNPSGPVSHPMTGLASCFRSAGGGMDCPGSEYGANAGQIWQMTFNNAQIGPPYGTFAGVPRSSPFFRLGNGIPPPAKKKPAKPAARLIPPPAPVFWPVPF